MAHAVVLAATETLCHVPVEHLAEFFELDFESHPAAKPQCDKCVAEIQRQAGLRSTETPVVVLDRVAGPRDQAQTRGSDHRRRRPESLKQRPNLPDSALERGPKGEKR